MFLTELNKFALRYQLQLDRKHVLTPSKKEIPNRFQRHGGTGMEQGGRAVVCPRNPREIRLGTRRTPFINFILF